MLKRDLELLLQRIEEPISPKLYLEQYTTPASIAADMLWEAYMRGDVENKVIADLGCGAGRLLLGSLLLGASYAVGIDIDCEILLLLDENAWRVTKLEGDIMLMYDTILSDIRKTPIRRIDTVIMNPPFGLRSKTSDIVFLEKAFGITETVYSLHLCNDKNRSFIKRFAREKGYSSEIIKTYNYPIRQLHEAHRRRIYYIKVDYWRFRRSRE